MGTGITETNVCQGGKGPYARAERDEQEHGGTQSPHCRKGGREEKNAEAKKQK